MRPRPIAARSVAPKHRNVLRQAPNRRRPRAQRRRNPHASRRPHARAAEAPRPPLRRHPRWTGAMCPPMCRSRAVHGPRGRRPRACRRRRPMLRRPRRVARRRRSLPGPRSGRQRAVADRARARPVRPVRRAPARNGERICSTRYLHGHLRASGAPCRIRVNAPGSQAQDDPRAKHMVCSSAPDAAASRTRRRALEFPRRPTLCSR